MWSRMSWSRSSSMRLRRFMISLLLRFVFGRAENARDRAGEFVPFAGFERQLQPALGRQPVKFGAAIVLRSSLFDGNPAALDEAMQRGIERTLLDLQHFVGVEFDGLGDGVAVRRAEKERAENQEIESALQELDAAFLVFFVVLSRHFGSSL